MKAVISVTGKDNIGIIAKVASECSLYDANIQDISQTVLSEYFAMIMLVDITKLTDSLFLSCTRIFLIQCTEYEAER